MAESYERIHRANLVGMGVLPLQFKPGENAASLGLTGREEFDVLGLWDGLRSARHSSVRVRDERGERLIEVICPARWPGRARVLPPGRHYARGPAQARGARRRLTAGSADRLERQARKRRRI